MSLITTPVTQLFKIKHPVILAGMDRAAGPELAAAVTNAGGLGVIGGYGFTPKALRMQVSGSGLYSILHIGCNPISVTRLRK